MCDSTTQTDGVVQTVTGVQTEPVHQTDSDTQTDAVCQADAATEVDPAHDPLSDPLHHPLPDSLHDPSPEPGHDPFPEASIPLPEPLPPGPWDQEVPCDEDIASSSNIDPNMPHPITHSSPPSPMPTSHPPSGPAGPPGRHRDYLSISGGRLQVADEVHRMTNMGFYDSLPGIPEPADPQGIQFVIPWGTTMDKFAIDVSFPPLTLLFVLL